MRISDWSSDVCSSDLADYIKGHHWQPTTQVLTYQDLNKLFAALNSGRCNAMTTDKSALVGWKGNAPDPSKFDILPETISKEPLAGFVRQDDQQWHTALSWIVYALVQAEEFGITSKRSEEHTSELQSLMRNSYAVFCLKKKNKYRA